MSFPLARWNVGPFVKDHAALEVWSPDYFRDVASRIEVMYEY